ncbi:T6SS phospholipase effector Tle1-like catalytic domain-containing protein [Streptomyces sp. NPDC102476]|uniref:T6SS phospholipase effector Tle1-like catalytic domain-containing protein n=1 Tax=Streptomyces sp. NPDC102476 TaxID=3366181 RepID=UPI0037F4D036
MLFGYGLTGGVRTMYRELSDLYKAPDDRVFLFGFSRGAFTVRALAGLLYRCGLPPAGCGDLDARFAHAWSLYKPHSPADDQKAEIERLQETNRTCGIHFIGLWDTVKSYGGINPVSLPHLRHNPIVRHVRHALALHERRAWFQPTTWGQLDLDKCLA